MPPRNPELPEGTDHIITGAMDTGTGGGAGTGSAGLGSTGLGSGGLAGTGGASSASTGVGSGTGTAGLSTAGTTGSTGSSGGTTGLGTGGAGGSSSGGGFMASKASDDTGGTSAGGGSSSAAQKIAHGVRSQVNTLTDQATDKLRDYAGTGKERATSALDDFAEVINDAARSIDERLGSQYGEYAHRAAGAVTSLSENLRGKTVDELLEDSRSVVRKSPGVAIGTAAVLGFALVRLVKAGLDEGNETRFTADAGRNIDFQPDTGGTSGRGA